MITYSLDFLNFNIVGIQFQHFRYTTSTLLYKMLELVSLKCRTRSKVMLNKVFEMLKQYILDQRLLIFSIGQMENWRSPALGTIGPRKKQRKKCYSTHASSCSAASAHLLVSAILH